MNANSVFIFLGPTLSINEAKKYFPTAYYLPPVRCGDIYRLLRYNPKIILIIDGVFEQQPAVWHKEILYALSNNIIVYGAASMGAMRAAELNLYGMYGIGKAFAYYKNTYISYDDEVSVLQIQNDNTISAATDALINIRETLYAAVTAKVLDEKECMLVLKKSSCHYSSRSFFKMIEEYTNENSQANIENFTIWLNHGNYIDQKAIDAIELFTLISSGKIIVNKSIVATHETLFSYALRQKVACCPYPIIASWVPRKELICQASKLLVGIYPLLKRLSILASLVFSCLPLTSKENNQVCDFILQHSQCHDTQALDQIYSMFSLLADLSCDAFSQLQEAKTFFEDKIGKHINIVLKLTSQLWLYLKQRATDLGYFPPDAEVETSYESLSQFFEGKISDIILQNYASELTTFQHIVNKYHLHALNGHYHSQHIPWFSVTLQYTGIASWLEECLQDEAENKEILHYYTQCLSRIDLEQYDFNSIEEAQTYAKDLLPLVRSDIKMALRKEI